MTYWIRFWLALDIFVNVLFAGNFGETISARVERASLAHHGWRGIYRWPLILFAKLLLGALDWLQPGHGQKAVAGDLARAQMIVELEQSVQTASLTTARAARSAGATP